MAKRVLGLVILVAWLGMIGWQVRREYFQPELARLAEAALSLAPGINFYTLTLGDRTVGQATSRLDTLADGFELEDLMSLELPALGQTGIAVARTRVRLDPSLVMQSFAFTLDSEVGRFEANGELGADTTLAVSTDRKLTFKGWLISRVLIVSTYLSPPAGKLMPETARETGLGYRLSRIAVQTEGYLNWLELGRALNHLELITSEGLVSWAVGAGLSMPVQRCGWQRFRRSAGCRFRSTTGRQRPPCRPARGHKLALILDRNRLP